jgi:cytochrome P450
MGTRDADEPARSAEADQAGSGHGAVWDPFSTSSSENPYGVYRVLREKHPAYCTDHGIWALLRYEAVQEAARDWRTYANTPSVDLDDTSALIGAGNLIDSDPPEHDTLRDSVRKPFSPRAINERFEGSVAAAVSELLETVSERDEVDVATDFAWSLPVTMISELLGLPRRDRALLQTWLIDFAEREPGTRQLPESMLRAGHELAAYLEDVIKRRRKKPGDDLLSQMIGAEKEGALGKGEVAGLALLLCDAGTQTTAGLIGNSLLALDQNRGQRDLLLQDPELGARGIEELLRFDSPVQYLARRTTRDVDVEGQTIPSGARVALLWGSANRDERRFSDPDRLDIARERRRHLGFGEGIHFCLGAPLARLEARIAIGEFIRRFPNYAVVGAVKHQRSHATRGLTALPVAPRGVR